MGTGTNIEWAHHTYNPWFGCTKISPACDHCYAAEWDKRYHGGEHWGAGVERKRTSIQTRNAPYKWARKARETGERPRVFCCSLADVFDNEVPAEWRDELWQVIRDTPELDWLLLTKRIGLVRQMLPEDWADGWPHVWLGITVVTQDEIQRDVRKLVEVPAAVRFLSCEPLIEEVSFRWMPAFPENAEGAALKPRPQPTEQLDGLRRLDWVILGGESGPGARPMHPDWARTVRDECAAADVPFLFKQWGDWKPEEDAPYSPDDCYLPNDGALKIDNPRLNVVPMHKVGKKAAGRLLDGVTHDEFPDAHAELAEAERSYAAEDSR